MQRSEDLAQFTEPPRHQLLDLGVEACERSLEEACVQARGATRDRGGIDDDCLAWREVPPSQMLVIERGGKLDMVPFLATA